MATGVRRVKLAIRQLVMQPVANWKQHRPD